METKKKEKLIELLKKIDSCDASIDWVEWQTENEEVSLEQLWNSCIRGDWLLLLLSNLQADRKKIAWTVCQCVKVSLFALDENELKFQAAIEKTEDWCKKECTLEELKADIKPAYAAAKASSAVAFAISTAIYNDDECLVNAMDAIYSVFSIFSNQKPLKQCADIVRDNFNFDYVLTLFEDYK